MLRRLGQPLGSGPLRYLRGRLKHYGIDTTHFVDEPLPRRPAQRYTKEVLEDAAAHCGSVRGILEYLGVPPYDTAYGHLKRRLAHFGIDTSHFPDAGQRGGPIDPNRLREAAADSLSLAETIRALGLSNGGGTRQRVKAALAAHGVPTQHFVGQGCNRNKRSPQRKTADEILRRLDPGAPRTRRSLLHRALQEKDVAYVCAKCGVGDVWQGHRLVLEIDHINGDRLDNRFANLRYLCPSCHSQTNTFAGRDPRASIPSQVGRDTQYSRPGGPVPQLAKRAPV
ncbi:HNH endonuclease [Streptomyces sp. NBC_01537]|uniref:HNH endonuclease n=1 Tax=Streptomyces sp. NBC_01537 TaxID=2903896 RepID=UPI003866CD38